MKHRLRSLETQLLALTQKYNCELRWLPELSIYLDNDPPFVNGEALRLVVASLASQTLMEGETALLRDYVGELRPKMNAYLGIVV